MAAVIFVFASFVAWFTWTQNARPLLFHVPKYQPPLMSVLLAVAAMAVLLLAAFAPRRPKQGITGPVPRPWVVGLAVFLIALPWCALVLAAFGALPGLPVAVPLSGGIALACLAFFLMRRWSSSPAWRDMHRLAAIFGALVASMLAGFGGFAGALPIDLFGKLGINVVGVVLMVWLARSKLVNGSVGEKNGFREAGAGDS